MEANTNIQPFQAYETYDGNPIYTGADRPVYKDGLIMSAIRRILLIPARGNIFPLTKTVKPVNFDLDAIKKAERQFSIVGGKEVQLQTADGDALEAMHFSAATFKEKMNLYFDMTVAGGNRFLTLKSEYIENSDAREFLRGLRTATKSRRSGNQVCIGPVRGSAQTGVAVKGNPTVIHNPGMGSLFQMNKTVIFNYLLNGVDVMAYNYRGHGKSEGNPTGKKLRLDIESAYQFVREELDVPNESILSHGFCLGGGIATDLAARHEGVNLFLDRTYSSTDAMASNVPFFLRPITRLVARLFFHFDNEKKIEQVKGHIGIDRDSEDNFIRTDHYERLNEHAKPVEGKVKSTIHSKAGHHKNWLHESKAKKEFITFLEQARLRRDIF